ncbi:hypothetical protein ZHAS_00003901 [Anopheles sinensis]|uniref:Uncharacterized protein n=1 Tax=Anopheles sinensis TaxID=74873 RepID=A0A084VFJ5_ANOSI|nr:hypothetical protein ZHAS_00003901 [Anopheles sinensis]
MDTYLSHRQEQRFRKPAHNGDTNCCSHTQLDRPAPNPKPPPIPPVPFHQVSPNEWQQAPILFMNP